MKSNSKAWITTSLFEDEFNISEAVIVTEDSWGEVQQKIMRNGWIKLCPFFFVEIEKTSENCNTISLLIDETVENGRELNLETYAEDVVQLLISYDLKLT